MPTKNQLETACEGEQTQSSDNQNAGVEEKKEGMMLEKTDNKNEHCETETDKVIDLTHSKAFHRLESTTESASNSQGARILTESKTQMVLQDVRPTEMLSPKPIELIR